MEEKKEKAPSKKMGTLPKVLIGCELLIVLLAICGFTVTTMGLFGAAKVANDISESIEKEEQKKQNEEDDLWNNPAKIGETVDVNGIEWTVLEAKDMGSTLKAKSPYLDDCIANSGRFIYVKIKIKNNRDKMMTTTGTRIYDNQKREYVNSYVGSCIDDSLFLLDNINPGIELTFVQVYEVPKDASGFKLEATDLDMFGDVHKYIDLGL